MTNIDRVSARKPHNQNAGYVCEMKSHHPKLPGHFVIYDRDQPNVDIDADERWILMHEPSSYHVSVSSLRVARELMKAMASGGDDVDLGQHEKCDVWQGDGHKHSTDGPLGCLPCANMRREAGVGSEQCQRCGGRIRRVFGHSSHVCPKSEVRS